DVCSSDLELIELAGDEVELLGKVLEDEIEDRFALGVRDGERAKDDEGQEQEGKERQHRVVRDGSGVRQVVTVVEAVEAVPRRTACQERDIPSAPGTGAKRFDTVHDPLTPAGALSAQARRTSVSRYTGILAPNQIRAARIARRLSGGL